MNCRQCKNRLMSSARPAFPDLAAQAHLAVCMSCRDFQQQLVLVEKNVGRVPVLPSGAKARLLQQLLQPKASPMGRAAARAGSIGSTSRLRLAWHEVGIGLAAAVVLIVCGAIIGNTLLRDVATDEQGSQQAQSQQTAPAPKLTNPFKKGPVAPGKTLVAKLMDCDLKLAQAQSPRERLEALAELASLLQRETTDLSKWAGAAELGKLAGLYQQVIQDGMLPQARELPMEERQALLPGVTAQLAQAERETQQAARTTPRSAEALRTIAAAARDGELRLRELLEGLE
jgi:hypothetical protein